MLRDDDKTGSRMRNIWANSKSWLTVFPGEESIVSETYSVEEKERSSSHGRRRSAGRNRKINDCGLVGKTGNLLNVLNTRKAGGNHKV